VFYQSPFYQSPVLPNFCLLQNDILPKSGSTKFRFYQSPVLPKSDIPKSIIPKSVLPKSEFAEMYSTKTCLRKNGDSTKFHSTKQSPRPQTSDRIKTFFASLLGFGCCCCCILLCQHFVQACERAATVYDASRPVLMPVCVQPRGSFAKSPLST
jgi:hypothetical protein